MLPDPLGDGNLVPVAEGVHDHSYAYDIMTTTREAVVPAVALGRGLHHGHTVRIVCVRPLLAQFAKLHDSTALIVVGHPSGNLVSGDVGNEHDGTEVEAYFSKHMLAAGWVPIAGETPIRTTPSGSQFNRLLVVRLPRTHPGPCSMCGTSQQVH